MCPIDRAMGGDVSLTGTVDRETLYDVRLKEV